jgi:hypothetical protein
MHRRRLSLAARIVLGIVACVLTIGGMFATLLLMGQDELIAWIGFFGNCRSGAHI